jgi:hypothetical protein
MDKLGCAKLNDGDIEGGTSLVEEAELMYRTIVLGYSEIAPHHPGEDEFDKIVMAWSR